jgi:biopolymer transport protein ExbB/TolQ
MEPESVNSILSSDVTMTLLVSGASLLAVMVPFSRGLLIGLQGYAATAKLNAAEIAKGLEAADSGSQAGSSIVVRMLHVLQKALRESERETCPTEFIVDASRQYACNDYDARYARQISMCANILPPIGFIGTTGGLLVLFLSMQVGSGSLELAALATALTSSIFALVGFAILEALKFRLYRRMLDRVEDAVAFAQQGDATNSEPDMESTFFGGVPEVASSAA